MHTIFETDCFILRSVPSGEANKVFELFTKEFGLLRATAQGVRHLKSKLRYTLTDFALVRVSLVRGKEYWRITTALKIDDAMTAIPDRASREVLVRIAALLRRLLQGEESHPELFVLMLTVFEILKVASTEQRMAIEEVAVLRVLTLLGYVQDDPMLRELAQGQEFSVAVLEQATLLRKQMVTEINRALRASSL